MRIEGDREASLEVRHGQVLDRHRRQLRMRGLLIVLLRRVQMTAQFARDKAFGVEFQNRLIASIRFLSRPKSLRL